MRTFKRHRPEIKGSFLRYLFLAILVLMPTMGMAQNREKNLSTPLPPIMIENAFVRATGAKTHNAIVYMTITNNTAEADKLIDASSHLAERVELHIIIDSRGLRRMHEVDEILLPAGAQVALAPGNYHLMLIGLKNPLKAGDEVPMELCFAKAPPIPIKVKVVEFRARRKGAE